ncbi:hypothetical protein IID04_02545 [PVC group bacterium]|nr:hypothetical protein [PVC group bacterium]
MKKLLAVIVLAVFLLSSSTAYAGDAWPWVLGGLAGFALLSTAAHSSHHGHHATYTSHAYHHAPVHTVVYDYPSTRVWVPGFYDAYGIYHSGYYTTSTYYTSY